MQRNHEIRDHATRYGENIHTCKMGVNGGLN